MSIVPARSGHGLLLALLLCLGADASIIVVASSEQGGGEFTQQQMDDDWTIRSGGSGVILAENFGSYANQAALHTAADLLTHVPASGKHVFLETSLGLSGSGQALKIQSDPDVGANGGSWGRTFAGQTSIYYQLSVRLNKAARSWRPLHGRTEVKYVNFNSFGTGQAVLSGRRGHGFPSVMTNGAGGPARAIGTVAYDGTYERCMSSAINNSNATITTEADALARWGVCSEALENVGPNTAQTYLDDEGDWPNSTAVAAGAQPFLVDEWLTIEVYLSHPNAGGTADRVMMWAAPYGDAPVLLIDSHQTRGDVEWNSPPDIWQFGESLTTFDQFELMNYDTPRGSTSDPAMPTFLTYFDEVIASTEPIPFPDPDGTPHPLLVKPTELSLQAGALDFGEDTVMTFAGLTGEGADHMNWQVLWHYDWTRNTGISIGKRQSPTNFNKMFEFDELANTFTVTQHTFPGTSRGHSYGIPTYDRTNGVSYYLENGGQIDRIVKHDPADPITTWSTITLNLSADLGADDNVLYFGSPDFASDSSAMQYHPNLFGAGSPGLIIVTQRGVIGIRLSDNTAHVIVDRSTWNTDTGTQTASTPSAEYLPGLDAALVYPTKSGSNLAVYKITAGPAFTKLSNPAPINLSPDNGSSAVGKMVLSPTDDSTVYVLEARGTGRVWKYNDATQDFDLQAFTHPFTEPDSNENWVVANADNLGVFLGIEETGLDYRMRVWRPDE